MGGDSPFGLTVAQLEQWCVDRGQAAYRGRQLAAWLYTRRVTDYAAMTDIPTAVRLGWQEQAPIRMPHVAAVHTSRDGSEKYRVEFADRESVEAVFMPMRGPIGDKVERLTACLSTQVGCALGCTFCATGTLGLHRNLTAGEIVAQVFLIQERIAPRRLTNLVFMGMGEPLHNFDQVVQAIRAITGEPGMQLGPKRLTVSTVGLIPEIYRLAETGVGVKLAISLNATTDAARTRTMPVNRRHPLAELMKAARHYAEVTGLRVTFEYVVLAGENDAEADARRLARLIEGIPCKINVIPFNPLGSLPHERPDDAGLERFRALLYPRCPAVTIRYSKGLDIGAACGQLVARG
jgi:23S rRNA (adenine2503-C2)-methyltransferase